MSRKSVTEEAASSLTPAPRRRVSPMGARRPRPLSVRNSPMVLGRSARRKLRLSPALEDDLFLSDEDLLPVADEGEGADEAVAPDVADVDDTSNYLSVYFREMSQLSILKPTEEYAIAKKIGGLEQHLWTRLLSFAPLTEAVVLVVEQGLSHPPPELAAVRGEAGRALFAGQAETPVLQQLATGLSDKLRRLDPDRVLVDRALAEILRIVGRDGRDGGLVIHGVSYGARAYKHARELCRTQRRIRWAKHAFVKANLRLVVSIARRFSHGRMCMSDLIQEGNLGLMKAVERFDYRRGFRFSTYASWWIRHAISRGLADKGRAVRLPVHMIDVSHKLARSRRDLASKLGRSPTTEELNQATGVGEAKIERMRTFLLDQPVSLDQSVSERDDRRLVDFIQDETPAGHPIDTLISARMSQQVRRVLDNLKPIEADILRQRFGLEGDRELTLKEIGDKYNLSRERIRQLQEQALSKMRRALTQGAV